MVRRARVTSLRTPRDAYDLVRGFMQNEPKEQVWAVLLNGRHGLLALHHVSTGTATASLIHPREIIGPVLRAGACAFILAHNHPSGSCEPSAEDHGVTDRIFRAAELVGIPMLDHLVIGADSFVSIRGRGSWPTPAAE